jgi:MSHA biogenesis protein MshL
MVFKRIPITCLIFALTACQAPRPRPAQDSIESALAAYQQQSVAASAPVALGALPDSISQALLPNKTNTGEGLFAEPKYDINAQQVDAVSFFAGLIKDTPYSAAIHPQVQGNISLTLKQVSLDQVFDLVSEIYGYDIQKKQNIYRIYPAGMRTETFSVNYLLMQRDGMTQTRITTGSVSQNSSNNNNNSNNQSQNSFSGNSGNNNSSSNNSRGSNGTNISTRSETDFWAKLEISLRDLIGDAEGRKVLVSPQAGLVTIKAMPDELSTVKELLKISEQSIQRQVVLEARILEVTLTDEYQQGINWSQILANSGSTEFNLSTSAGNFGNKISASLGGLTSLSFLNKDFSGMLSLLSTQGNVQVLSSPRVTATNNQKAVIKVGEDEYFVTDISSQSTISSSSTSITPNIELTPFFSGIALDVTPQIDKQGGVLLHVHPSVIETTEQEKIITVNQEQFVLPLAQSNIRESDTVIHAQSGEIVVIGGLMQTILSDSQSKTPLLGSIPLLGELFKSRQDRQIKKELVILLKPTVVGPDTWKQQLQQSRDNMADWLYVD